VTAPLGGIINGRYELRRRLLGGGMGTVWEAYDLVLKRRVVAKALISETDQVGDDLEIMRRRLEREALALARVDHPAVVTVHDLIYDGQDPWIVMGFVDGPTLAQYVQDNPRLPEQEIASIGLVILQGLLACHAKKVYHRDVKPANIIRTPEGSARLVDFGIARIGGMHTLTPTSKVLGTPEYMAPELFKSPAPSQRTDLWSLGATLYYALEGRSPFARSNIHATIGALLSDSPPAPPGRPGRLADLLQRMLRKPPQARPDATVVLDELRRLTGASASADRPVWQDRPARRQSRSADPASYLQNVGWLPAQSGPPPASRNHPRVAVPAKPLTELSGRPASESAKKIASYPPDRAITELLALEDEEAARILLECDDAVAGHLLSLTAAQPAWSRKITEMVPRARAGQFLSKMTAPASAAALALPPMEVAAQVLSRADDDAVKDVVSELSRTRPSRGAQLILALDDLEAGRVTQVLSNLEPRTVARLLHYVNVSERRKVLLDRLPRQFRPLVERRLAALADSDLGTHFTTMKYSHGPFVLRLAGSDLPRT
jgi:serine/threonine protein kinase